MSLIHDTSFKENMRDDQDAFPVPGSKGVHSSPGDKFRNSTKGISPSKTPGSKNSLLSSSVRNGYNKYDRNVKRSISEIMLLATNGERRTVVGGKTATKRTSDSKFLGEADLGSLDMTQVSPVESKRPTVADSEHLEHGSLSAHCVDRHMNDSPRQHSYSEKVSKWLEESENSNVTELHDSHSLAEDDEVQRPERQLQQNEHERVSKWLEDSDHAEVTEARENCILGNDAELQIQLQQHEDVVTDLLQTLATAILSKVESGADVNENEDTKQITEPLLKDDLNVHAPVKVDDKIAVEIDEKVLDTRLHLTKFFVRYLKITTCLAIVFLVVVSQIMPESWDRFEPPPT